MTLLGYGKTTQAIAKRFGGCTIYDDKITEPSHDAFGNTLLPSSMFGSIASNLEITSPGIPPSHFMIQQATNLISEYDFFSKDMPYSIWISGTNGKTTTTEMLYHLLQNKGAQMGGNVGTPLADMDKNASLWILETSSFTLHYTSIAKPNLYILLPITPDHISWHGSREKYEEAKLKPLAWLSEGEVAIVPSRYAHHESSGHIIGYETAEDLCTRFNLDKTKIRFKGVFLIDALLALAVTRILFDEVDYDLLNSFVVDPHKQEEFYDKKRRLWIDDSKATNLDATIEAVKVFSDKPLHLILGGDDKGVDLTALFSFLAPLSVTIYAIGANTEKLVSLSHVFNISCVACYHLETAVQKIDAEFHEGYALLSPACASLDQFSGYKERGEKFQSFVKCLS